MEPDSLWAGPKPNLSAGARHWKDWAKRFTNNERTKIREKETKNRDMVTEIMNLDTFIQKMNTEFQELATYETEGNPDADLAPKISQI